MRRILAMILAAVAMAAIGTATITTAADQTNGPRVVADGYGWGLTP
jgi:hypothetical protein